MKLVERFYYSVDRPPAKFRCVRSPFDSPTVIRSGTVVGLIAGRFGLRNCRLAALFSLLSPRPLFTAHTHANPAH